MSERWSCPLVVELDGPLNKADRLAEGVLTMMLARPSDLFGLLAAASGGRRAAVGYLAARGHMDASTLPLRKEFTDYLEAERAAGRDLHLVTADPQAVADGVAARLGLFASARRMPAT